MAPDLPGEMTDSIIGAVPVDDKKTLCSCSLVCRAWLPASRHRLFTTIRIYHRQTYDLLVDRVLHSDDMRPYLATATRQITLSEGYCWDRQDFPPYRAPSTLFHLFFGCFPLLETLRLKASAMTFPFHRITDHLLFSQFTNLRCLQIRYTLIPGSFTTLRRMISALQALEELEINDVWTQRSWPLSQWELESSRRWGSKLRCFRCIFWDKPNPRSEAARATCCLEDLMGWLSTTSAVNLKKLDLQVASFQAPPRPILDLLHGPECISFLHTMGASVSSLTLEIAGVASPIPYFTNLSDLILVTGRDKKLLPITWGQVCSMLSGLRSRLRYLRLGDIKYHGPSIGDVSHTDPCFCLTSGPHIGELDAVLARDIFKNLTEVEFRLGRTLICPTGIHDPRWGAHAPNPPYPLLSRSELMPQVEQSLPQLYARGIITFDEYWNYRARPVSGSSASCVSEPSTTTPGWIDWPKIAMSYTSVF